MNAIRIFKDRAEAGRELAQRLLERQYDKPVVLALPRGGVPVAVEVAKALDAPLDLVLVRKIGVPFQPELAASLFHAGKGARRLCPVRLVAQCISVFA